MCAVVGVARPVAGPVVRHDYDGTEQLATYRRRMADYQDTPPAARPREAHGPFSNPPTRGRNFGTVAKAYAAHRPSYPDTALDWALAPVSSPESPASARRGELELLDLAAGTGKLTASLVRRSARVTAVEPDPEMLAVLRAELPSVKALPGTAEDIPLPDASVDAVLVGQAFHWFNPEPAAAEIARVLRPGGRLAILEFGVPRIPGIRPVYLWYFTHVVPRIGRVISGHGAAYSYLPASVGTFAPPAQFVETLRRAGFSDVRADPLTFGIVYLYTARRAAT